MNRQNQEHLEHSEQPLLQNLREYVGEPLTLGICFGVAYLLTFHLLKANVRIQ